MKLFTEPRFVFGTGCQPHGGKLESDTGNFPRSVRPDVKAAWHYRVGVNNHVVVVLSNMTQTVLFCRISYCVTASDLLELLALNN